MEVSEGVSYTVEKKTVIFPEKDDEVFPKRRSTFPEKMIGNLKKSIVSFRIKKNEKSEK